MPLRKILALLVPLAGSLCLALGFASLGMWLALLGLLALPVWLFAWFKPSRALPYTALVLSITLSVVGVFVGAEPTLMLLSATLALASWDLALWNLALADNSPADAQPLLAQSHYASLALALGLGLLIALSGRFLRLQLPFGVMFFLVLFALFGLERLWRSLGG